MVFFKKYIPFFIFILFIGLSCTKETSTEYNNTILPLVIFPSCKPAPLLTGKNWKADTILINPPETYAQINADAQASYRGAYLWFKGARILFNTDCKVYQPLSDWDAGFDKWSLSDDNKDIRMLLSSGFIDTLYNCKIDSLQFTYQKKFPAFTLTYILK